VDRLAISIALAACLALAQEIDLLGLERLGQKLAIKGTRAFLVRQHGKTVYQWYAQGVTEQTRHGTASLAKALVGGTSLMLAMADGRIRPDDLATKYIPSWRDDARKSRITIRQLATHTSGLEDAEQDGLPHEDLPGWKGGFWRRSPDPFSIAIRDAPVLFEPGTQYHYSNTGIAALGYAVTASLGGKTLRQIMEEKIMRPLGVADQNWSIGYGHTYDVDGLKLQASWGGGSFTPPAAGMIGELMMREGRTGDNQLVPRALVSRMLAYAGMPKPGRTGGHPAPASGLCWYTNYDGIWPRLPRDAFAGAGAGHNVMLVIPSLELVVVRNGADLRGKQTRSHFWSAIVEEIFNPVMEASATNPPYPPSSVIRSINFAPVETVRREAVDSDNWPVTWGADNHLYTSYGDGFGFDPRTEKKLSMGFARIEGGPEDFRAFNIRSATGETVGDGARGAKASGLLMVDGALYMWVRNTGNAQLVWSEDQGRTWTWGFKLETSFGSPAFLNFGRNYEGATDNYVYVYSQDGPSAYQTNDSVVAARVRKDRIRDRAGYEFFSPGGWTRDISQRGPVFTFPRHCQRVDAVYNAGLKRYLLAVSYGHYGGWGIFDAPTPVGPWTTAFHTESWGLGGTHGYRLPSKWISPDGRTMWLVFSGVRMPSINYDAFSLRRMELKAP
jgi:CubicO group peptidase (beta-lactamase class C family)